MTEECSWKCVSKELPPNEGVYQILNEGDSFIGAAFYDGWGFVFNGHYVEPELWRPLAPRKKRFGKVKDAE